MKKAVDEIQYPLKERIGAPLLLVGREKEFAEYYQWISRIPKELSKSRAILARKKGGKTAFLQRLFNQLWSDEKGEVIPFYLEILERKLWFPDFAQEYYQKFASQYISFLEQDPSLVSNNLDLDEISEYGEKNNISLFIRDVKKLKNAKKEGSYDLMWEVAFTAPHRFAAMYKKFFLVIIDEFQNLSEYIYRDRECRTSQDQTIPGSYHEVSESKIAPMLVTGSQVGWLLRVINKHLQMGRLKKLRLSPYLEEEDGLEAVYRYATHYEVPVTNKTAVEINDACYSDPFFISCVINSAFPGKKLTTLGGVSDTVEFEAGNRDAELSLEWLVWLEKALKRINEHHAKNILLFLTKNSDKIWTPQQLKKELNLEPEVKEIHEKLEKMAQADLIYATPADNEYQGQNDGTLYRVLQARFKNELRLFSPKNLQEGTEEYLIEKAKTRSLQGTLNNAVGKLAEMQLAIELYTLGTFPLSSFFTGIPRQKKFELQKIYHRNFVQGSTGFKKEIDLIIEGSDQRTLLIEVKKQKTKMGVKTIEEFQEKVKLYSRQNPKRKSIPAFLSLGGFTRDALKLCQKQKIGTATEIPFSVTD